MALPSFLTGSLWKAGAIGAVLVSLVIGFFLISTTMENRQIGKERDKLALSINDPKTGYIARLTQARANVAELENAIVVQNTTFKKQSEEARLSMEKLKKELAAAQRRSLEAERRLAVFMSTKPQGATLEDRVNDIDRRILKDLNR